MWQQAGESGIKVTILLLKIYLNMYLYQVQKYSSPLPWQWEEEYNARGESLFWL